MKRFEEILKEYEDNNEMHFHDLDKENIIYPAVKKYEKEIKVMLEEYVNAIENETIIIKENEDNDGWENFGGRFYNKAKKLLNELNQ